MARPCGEFKTSYFENLGIAKTRVRRIGAAIFLPIVALFPFIVNQDPYLITVTSLMFISIIAVQGLNIILGYTGQISLAQGGMMALGGYSFIWFTKLLGIPWFLSLILAGLFTCAIGCVFGVTAIRIKLFYVAISTLALETFVVWFISTPKYLWLTGEGGHYGLHISVFPYEYYGIMTWYLCFALALMACLAVANLGRSALGRAFKSVRDNDVAAEILGINVPAVKIAAFGIGAFWIGISGALFATWLKYIGPEHFLPLDLTIDHYTMLILGGIGTIWGVVIGAIFMISVIEMLKFYLPVLLPGLGFALYPFKSLIFSALIILFLIMEPKGLIEIFAKVKRYFLLMPYAY